MSTDETAHEVVTNTHVVVMHLRVGRATAQYVLVPRESADASTVPSKTPQLAFRCTVPDLHLTLRGANA